MRVAIVHYWLVTHRGGERVVEALAEMFPQADIFTLVYDKRGTSEVIRRHPIHTSFIQKLPLAKRHYRSYLPLFPLALEHFDLRGYDLIISSESGPAKGVLTSPETCHICYCHTPMRYVWNSYHDYRASAGFLKRLAMPFFIHYLRQWDQATAGRVDYFVANSHNTARRIRKFYRRESQVIYPPLETRRFSISHSVDSYYLAVAEMVPYKRIDLAVEAFNRLGAKLLVVGNGPEWRRWRRLAKPNVQFLGRVEDQELARLYASCRALIFPGEEDFGLTPLEAQASGRPVIAYQEGGALETVLGYTNDGDRTPETCTGLLFPSQTVNALVEAVRLFETVEGRFSPAFIRAHAERFDVTRFNAEMQAFVNEKLAEFRGHLRLPGEPPGMP
jgi:glycosyltransferase involved in cell wall biosynthesis